MSKIELKSCGGEINTSETPKLLSRRGNAKMQLVVKFSAKDRLLNVELSDGMLEKISALCSHLAPMACGAIMIRASRSIAALRQADVVALKDVRAAALIALPHRMRRDPLDDTGSKVRVEVAAKKS